MKIKTLADLFLLVKGKARQRMVVVNGIDSHSIEAAEEARKLGVVDVILTGDPTQIEATCEKLGVEASAFKIVAADTEESAAHESVKMIHEGAADFIMKGLISTDKYMRAILNKEYGLVEPGDLLTHITVIENPSYHKLLTVSDVAIIPYPSLKQKEIMIRYLLQVAIKLGVDCPKLALIAPTEQIIESIPACADAAQLTKMASEGAFPEGIVDGPMALDVALDKESAQIKNIKAKTAGDADCLLFPNIDAGNVFYKVNSKFCHAKQAALVYGAKVPVVLSSRGDSSQTKLNSIVLAALMSH